MALKEPLVGGPVEGSMISVRSVKPVPVVGGLVEGSFDEWDCQPSEDPRRRSSRHSDGTEDLAASKIKPGPSHVGSLSLQGTMSNLILAVLGAGQLTLPFAMSQLGLGFGVLALLTFTLLGIHSLRTLTFYLLHFTPDPAACLESYAELVIRVLGNSGSNLCCLLLAIYAWGGAVSFMIILKGELTFLVSLLPSLEGFIELVISSLPAFINESGSLFLIMLATAVIWPLSSFQDLSALKKFAPLGCTAALFITCVVTMCAAFPKQQSQYVCRQRQSDAIMWWPTSFTTVAATLPLLSFALNSSWAYIPILCTLRNKTESRLMGLIVGSNGIIMGSYMLLAMCGYGMFCNSTKPNILESLGDAYFPRNADGSDQVPVSFQGVAVLCARMALTVQLSLALPMRFFVARKTLTGDQRSSFRRLMISGVLVLSATLLATMHFSLATVLGIVSSICASMIIYILPALVDLYFRFSSKLDIFASALSLLIGVFILTAGLVANILGVAVGS